MSKIPLDLEGVSLWVRRYIPTDSFWFCYSEQEPPLLISIVP